jgi:hypothetical protein
VRAQKFGKSLASKIAPEKSLSDQGRQKRVAKLFQIIFWPFRVISKGWSRKKLDIRFFTPPIRQMLMIGTIAEKDDLEKKLFVHFFVSL